MLKSKREVLALKGFFSSFFFSSSGQSLGTWSTGEGGDCTGIEVWYGNN